MRTRTVTRAALAAMSAGVMAMTMTGCTADALDGVVFGTGGVECVTSHGGGGGGASPAGGDGGSGGTTSGTTSITTSSTTSVTTTSSTTSTDPCLELACATTPWECGAVQYDCNGDTVNETYLCGMCDFPAACGGSEIPHQCGTKCQSKWEVECTAAGLPSGWTMPSDCIDSYKFINGELLFCSGCGFLDCIEASFNGNTVLCCPNF